MTYIVLLVEYVIHEIQLLNHIYISRFTNICKIQYEHYKDLNNPKMLSNYLNCSLTIIIYGKMYRIQVEIHSWLCNSAS